MERLIRAANFTRYYSRDVDKLSQLPRNCRVRATYHPSNLAQREIAASCAARVPHASFPRAFPSVHDVCIYTMCIAALRHHSLPPPFAETLASSTTRRVSCIALGNLSAIALRPTARPTSSPLLLRLTKRVDFIDARTPTIFVSSRVG